MPTPALEIWPVTVGVPFRSAFAIRNSSRSMPEPVGELVVERLLRDRRLRHAEAAEGAGGRDIGVDRPASAR